MNYNNEWKILADHLHSASILNKKSSGTATYAHAGTPSLKNNHIVECSILLVLLYLYSCCKKSDDWFQEVVHSKVNGA